MAKGMVTLDDLVEADLSDEFGVVIHTREATETDQGTLAVLDAKHVAASKNGHKPWYGPVNFGKNGGQEVIAFCNALLPEVTGKKLDRLFELLLEFRRQIEDEYARTKKKQSRSQGGPRFTDRSGRISWLDPSGDEVPLCNFTAQIVKEVYRDDGVAVPAGEMHIIGQLESGQPLGAAVVTHSKYGAMNWVVESWGSRAVIEAGSLAKDRLRQGIQVLSPPPVRKTIYTHTGWREVGEVHYFLHGGGAIGPEGLTTDISVDLAGGLHHVVLPAPPEGDELCAAVRASLGLFDPSSAPCPPRIMAAILGGAYRAPLCSIVPCDVTIHVEGQTGGFKTTMLGLAQAHYGAAFDWQHMTASWISTGNALESVLSRAKDILCTIDDFNPTGSKYDIDRYHATGERVGRSVGNQAGRDRLNSNMTQRPTYVARGVTASTGESTPRGHSLAARFLLVHVVKGEVTFAALEPFLAQAREGVFARAMAGYIHWLAAQMETLHATLPEEFRALRSSVDDAGRHARLSTSEANVLLGWVTFLRFATECGAITPQHADGLRARAQEGLRELAVRTQMHIATQDPAAHFITLLSAALHSGAAYLEDLCGGHPEDAQRWGWRVREIAAVEMSIDGNNSKIEPWEPLSKARIGWVDDDHVYLDKEAAYAAVQKFAQQQGLALQRSPTELWSALKEKGYLASCEGDHDTVRRDVPGQKKKRVLDILVDTLEQM